MQNTNMLGSLRPLVALVLLATVPLAMAWGQEEAVDEPEPAIQAELADESLLLDIVANDGKFVAVGSRGHVLLSDNGRDWRQAQSVPLQATLTRATSFGRRLWAVGHDSAIISSSDGGETWFIQHREAQVDPDDPMIQAPILDVLFVNPNTGFAIGAYGRFMTTADGGINWQTHRMTERVESEAIDWAAVARQQDDIETIPADSQGDEAYDPEAGVNKGCYEYGECHLNAMLNLGDGRLLIAAEAGYGFRSVDEGETWESFKFPYPGSMFGLVAQRGCVLAFGLRGHVQKSCDFGSSWNEVPTGIRQSLMGGDIDPDGTAIVVGSGATRVYIEPDGSIDKEADQLGSDYAAVKVLNGNMILVGENGVRYE